MKPKLLVSACLLGTPCRYDGKSKKNEAVCALAERFELIPVCPEVLGGLPTPRTPSERRGACVVRKDGRDVTAEYRRGAECALETARREGVLAAVLPHQIHVASADRSHAVQHALRVQVVCQRGCQRRHRRADLAPQRPVLRPCVASHRQPVRLDCNVDHTILLITVLFPSN